MAVASKKAPKSLQKRRRDAVFATIYVLIYITICSAVLVAVEGDWSWIDAIYFSMATMSTVGYGDFYPSTSGTRFFAILMIILGVGLVFPLVAEAVSLIFMPITHGGRALLQRFFPPRYIDIEHNGSHDYEVPGRASVYYLKNLLPSILLITVVQLASASIFVALEGDWSFGAALYHCLVTVSTVGYGDMYIATQGGRLFSSFHMLIGVCLFAELLASLDSLRHQRALSQQRIKAIQQELTPTLFRKLTTKASELRVGAHGTEDDERVGLSEPEFVLVALIDLGIVDQLTLQVFLKQFRALDVDPDGRLTAADLETIMKLNKSELQRLRSYNSSKFNAALSQTSVGSSCSASLTDKVLPFRAGPSTDTEAGDNSNDTPVLDYDLENASTAPG